jgi:hypothetical protein
LYTFSKIVILIFIIDEHDSAESDVVLENLEKIDGETDNLDIPFVKMGDPRYARKWGVTKLPSVVYFRKRFPNIYRGSIVIIISMIFKQLQ